MLGGIAAAAVAARGVARGHVADLLRRVPGSSRSRGAGAVEGAVLALVVAGIVQLAVAPGSRARPGRLGRARHHRAGRCAGRGPAAAVRQPPADAPGRWTAAAPSALYGWAGVARRAGTARTTGVLAAAICLLLVGVQAWTVAARERSARALAETGAAVVLDVQAPTARGLCRPWRTADPSGTYAMAGHAAGRRTRRPPGRWRWTASRADAVAGFAGRGPDDVRALIIDPHLPTR